MAAAQALVVSTTQLASIDLFRGVGLVGEREQQMF